MQILAIPKPESTRSHLSRQMYRLGSRGYRARLAWQVASGDLDHDKLDALKPPHLLAQIRTSRVIGCVRLLPAMGPAMVATKFLELSEAGALSGYPQMVELSRFSFATSLEHERVRSSHFHHASLCLFTGIVDGRAPQEYVDVAIATNLRIARRLKRAKRSSQRLAEPPLINRTKDAGCHLSTNMGTFERLFPRNVSLPSSTLAPAK